VQTRLNGSTSCLAGLSATQGTLYSTRFQTSHGFDAAFAKLLWPLVSYANLPEQLRRQRVESISSCDFETIRQTSLHLVPTFGFQLLGRLRQCISHNAKILDMTSCPNNGKDAQLAEADQCDRFFICISASQCVELQVSMFSS